MHSLYHQLKDSVDFLTVYILEAHAQDEWPISSSRFDPKQEMILVEQPKFTLDRITLAKQFIERHSYELPVLVDKIDNAFEEVYAPWPLRFYIVYNGVLVYKAQPVNCTYRIETFRDAVVQYARLYSEAHPRAT